MHWSREFAAHSGEVGVLQIDGAVSRAVRICPVPVVKPARRPSRICPEWPIGSAPVLAITDRVFGSTGSRRSGTNP